MATNKELLKRLIYIASKEVGVREEGGNNCGAHIREYQKATWLEPGAWPWCSAFCCWVLQQWLNDPEVASALNLKGMSVNEWRCKDASAFGWEKWAKFRGLQVLPETAKAQAGDFVIFDFSHIGIVTTNQVGAVIQTCEGNTNGKGERDSTSGDGVWAKKRAYSLTKVYVRLLP